jgi:hypothetical protein
MISGAFPIDLNANWNTANDADDVDTGPNGLQNHPELTTVTQNASSTVANGTLDSAPSTTYTLDFYRTGVNCQDSFSSETPRHYLGSASVTTNVSGDGTFSEPFPLTMTDRHGIVVTATAPNGDTSEVSPCRPAVKLDYTLTVTKPTVDVSYPGGGTVTSSPAGLNCGPFCTPTFKAGTDVTLTASPAPGYRFDSWSGDCTGSALTCDLFMDGHKNVTALFTEIRHTVTVTNSTGHGIASGIGINCGIDCTEDYREGTVTYLSASPDTGFTFGSWGGDCTVEVISGQSYCKLTMNGPRSATVSFVPQQFVVGVTSNGGTVVSDPAGIDCPSDCSQSFDYGTVVTLTATETEDTIFTGWSGSGCSGTDPECTFTVTGARSITANFTAAHTLTISKSGTGTGTVTSGPSGINCGATCSAKFPANTSIFLNQTPASDSTFTGWTGATCSSAGTGTCNFSLTTDTTVGAGHALKSYALVVSKSGAGSGTVTSAPSGVSCGVDCTENFTHGTSVTLTAGAETGSTFVGWGGACAGSNTTCELSMTQGAAVTAGFAITQRTLTVGVLGNGSGTVASSPIGITCPGDCTQNYNYGTSVTLTPTPAADSNFTGWTGACTGTGECVVTMEEARDVSATFTLKTYTLNVVKAGAGSGTVTSEPAGIDCGSDCDQIYNHGTDVTLTAAASAGSTFSGWTGPCTGTDPCVVSMTQARTATATFTRNAHSMSVIVAAAGSSGGTVTSSPSGIDCGADCSELFDEGTSVTLTATPDPDSTFQGWSGACTGDGACIVDMTQTRSIAASFAIKTHDLNVDLDGGGSGSVSSDVAGISCGLDCSHTYNHGTLVTLSPTASEGSDFVGWSGACTGTGECVVTMDEARAVTAAFDLRIHVLDVAPAGDGTGMITSEADGIACGGDCSEPYEHGTPVVLTATPSAGSRFAGWSGACTGTGTCSVEMTEARAVTATFELNVYRPDGMVKLSTAGSFLGNNVYNATGRSQTVATKIRRARSKTFLVRIQNDGDVTDSFRIKGTRAALGFTLKYMVGTTNVTKQVLAGTYRFNNLAPGATKTLKVVIGVQRRTRVGKPTVIAITDSSVANPTLKDVVRTKGVAAR